MSNSVPSISGENDFWTEDNSASAAGNTAAIGIDNSASDAEEEDFIPGIGAEMSFYTQEDPTDMGYGIGGYSQILESIPEEKEAREQYLSNIPSDGEGPVSGFHKIGGKRVFGIKDSCMDYDMSDEEEKSTSKEKSDGGINNTTPPNSGGTRRPGDILMGRKRPRETELQQKSTNNLKRSRSSMATSSKNTPFTSLDPKVEEIMQQAKERIAMMTVVNNTAFSSTEGPELAAMKKKLQEKLWKLALNSTKSALVAQEVLNSTKAALEVKKEQKKAPLPKKIPMKKSVNAIEPKKNASEETKKKAVKTASELKAEAKEKKLYETSDKLQKAADIANKEAKKSAEKAGKANQKAKLAWRAYNEHAGRAYQEHFGGPQRKHLRNEQVGGSSSSSAKQ